MVNNSSIEVESLFVVFPFRKQAKVSGCIDNVIYIIVLKIQIGVLASKY